MPNSSRPDRLKPKRIAIIDGCCVLIHRDPLPVLERTIVFEQNLSQSIAEGGPVADAPIRISTGDRDPTCMTDLALLKLALFELVDLGKRGELTFPVLFDTPFHTEALTAEGEYGMPEGRT